MTSIIDSTRNLIHDTAQGLITADVMTKMSDMYANFLSAGLGVANDALKVVRDITAPPPPTPPGP